ncbi:MAG: N-acetylmuramoyl-L-alanine amidase [Coleofasciculus sp. B1-GNL1-01]|uniref:N-acetylmuramoyl-L-alanine amidase n=1 Tax=Coleofasciculus sp. B1-GNL1-01 TaxID=3068484 RepID=UPI0032F80962
MRKIQWLLLLISFWSTFLVSLPAEAARLLLWRFDASQNQLEFTTDGSVQPTAQLIPNPLRLVIDLPGTTLGRPSVSQPVGGGIREIRVGQFDRQTTRIVVEIAPGYTIDPQQIQFRGASPRQWFVQLPEPQRITTPAPRPLPPTTPPPQPTPRPTPPEPSPDRTESSVQLDPIQVTRDGFFIRTNEGEVKEIQVERSRDRETIEFDVEGITLPPALRNQTVSVNRYGVSQIQLSQQSGSSPTRITLNVNRESPDWQMNYSAVGGLVLLPRGVSASQLQDLSPRRVDREPTAATNLATIESVQIAQNGTQLLIRADQRIRASGNWNPSANQFQITIPDAQLADRIQGPQLGVNSPLSQVRLRQPDSRTVVIVVQPDRNTQIGELNQPSEQLLALSLRQRRVVSPPTGTLPVPPPERLPPESSPPPTVFPGVRNTRVVVMLDPGHGGRDPGAVGIGGLQEKNVILPISLQVAQLLEQQGVQTILTRSDDRFISLRGRVQLAEQTNVDLFVSIHANAISLSRPDVNGVETYYYANGRGLAEAIQNSLLQSTGMRNRGVKRGRFYVIRRTSMPSALVEVGFVTGAEDAPRLATPEFRSLIAQAIARGILLYIQQTR